MLHRLRLTGFPRLIRGFAASSGAITKPSKLDRVWGATKWFMTTRAAVPLPLVLWAGSTTLQHYFGSEDNFFEGRFKTTKDLDDLAEFYQAEDLLRIIAVFPFLFNLFMNKVVADTETPSEESALLSPEETHFRVSMVGMEVSFEIIQHEEEIDGESKPTSFMRHERFIDWVPVLADFGYKTVLWDQTWVYGFDRQEDGTVEVYHRGEKFEGPWPVRMIVFLHQYYVLWACEKYINGDAFGTEDLDKQQEQMACMPLHVFKRFVRRVRADKEKALKALRDDPKPDSAAIANMKGQVDQLLELESREQASIALARRKAASGSVAAKSSVKVVAEDAATQEVLKSVMMDEKGFRDKYVLEAVKEVATDAELDYQDRPRNVKDRSSA